MFKFYSELEIFGLKFAWNFHIFSTEVGVRGFKIAASYLRYSDSQGWQHLEILLLPELLILEVFHLLLLLQVYLRSFQIISGLRDVDHRKPCVPYILARFSLSHDVVRVLVTFQVIPMTVVYYFRYLVVCSEFRGLFFLSLIPTYLCYHGNEGLHVNAIYRTLFSFLCFSTIPRECGRRPWYGKMLSFNISRLQDSSKLQHSISITDHLPSRHKQPRLLPNLERYNHYYWLVINFMFRHFVGLITCSVHYDRFTYTYSYISVASNYKIFMLIIFLNVDLPWNSGIVIWWLMLAFEPKFGN